MSPQVPARTGEDGYYADFEKRIAVITTLLGTAVFLASSVFISAAFAVSFLAGALVSHWNFAWMKQGVDLLVTTLHGGDNSAARRSQQRVIFKYLLRYALIGIFLYVIFRFRFFDVRAAACGLFLPIAAVFAEAAIQLLNTLVRDRKHGTP